MSWIHRTAEGIATRWAAITYVPAVTPVALSVYGDARVSVAPTAAVISYHTVEKRMERPTSDAIVVPAPPVGVTHEAAAVASPVTLVLLAATVTVPALITPGTITAASWRRW